MLGIGSAPTRSISWLHWAALSGLVETEGAGAVRPEWAECATVAAAAGLSAAAAGAARNSRWMRFQSAEEACVLGKPGKRMRLTIECGTNSLGSVSSVRIVSSVIDSGPWCPAIGVPLIAAVGGR
jgi:hypothetical protein